MQRWWVMWPLFAAIMGFALGSSVFWGLYGPNTTIEQADAAYEQKAAKHEAKSKKEETDEALAWYTLWLMGFTGVLAFATIGLGVATVGLYLTGEKQIRLIRRNSATQSRQMQNSITEAKRAADIAERALVASNRPWIKVDIAVGGPIRYDVNGVNFTFNYVLTNIGHAPATNVWVSPRVIAPDPDSGKPFDPRGELRTEIAQLKSRPPSPWGFALFPGDSIVQPITVTIGTDVLKKITEKFEVIYPQIIGAVDYRMGFDDAAHQTGFIFEVRRSEAPRPVSIEKNRWPPAIFIDEGDIPAEEVRISRSFIEGGYAD